MAGGVPGLGEVLLPPALARQAHVAAVLALDDRRPAQLPPAALGRGEQRRARIVDRRDAAGDEDRAQGRRDAAVGRGEDVDDALPGAAALPQPGLEDEIAAAGGLVALGVRHVLGAGTPAQRRGRRAFAARPLRRPGLHAPAAAAAAATRRCFCARASANLA
ncbi:MAG: hypothetical protein ISN26_07610 [Betaproteobacteria bacterium AqS2]|uniref:Uncharacterized protein n=1 Tax=Candidatus Amphirhobacter heronislandensis TaxID=1732024 RepID=A0A930UG14_9GAMM|nr:hypothetical protein [Betaproteobacteria bacterium AqS2]